MSQPLLAALADTVAASGDRFLPHGYCFLWNRPLLWTHVVADTLIGAAYVTISVSLAWLVHRARREIPFSAAFVMFGLFIITCGLTHFLEVVTFWEPIYPTLGAVKVLTAVASVSTAIAMPLLAPRVVDTARTARTARAHELAVARADERNAVLAESNARLAELNASLSEALAVADRARAEAEEANRAKATFLATMSHELRTPLNAIGGHVALVEIGVHGPVTVAQAQALDRVQHAQRHLLGLINDVLNFARLEAGRVEYQSAPVHVAPLVHEVVALLEPQAAARHQRLVAHVAPTAPMLAFADADKVRQVLVNVIGNAVKFTGVEGRIEVHVREDLVADTTIVEVADTGCGIPADRLEAIFDPFVQVHALTTVHAGGIHGTGLGLAISRELARGMGGDLVAESVEGRGATFRLVLPRRARDD